MVAGILLPNLKMGRKILSMTADRPKKKIFRQYFWVACSSIKENKMWDFTNILKCGT